MCDKYATEDADVPADDMFLAMSKLGEVRSGLFAVVLLRLGLCVGVLLDASRCVVHSLVPTWMRLARAVRCPLTWLRFLAHHSSLPDSAQQDTGAGDRTPVQNFDSYATSPFATSPLIGEFDLPLPFRFLSQALIPLACSGDVVSSIFALLPVSALLGSCRALVVAFGVPPLLALSALIVPCLAPDLISVASSCAVHRRCHLFAAAAAWVLPLAASSPDWARTSTNAGLTRLPRCSLFSFIMHSGGGGGYSPLAAFSPAPMTPGLDPRSPIYAPQVGRRMSHSSFCVCAARCLIAA